MEITKKIKEMILSKSYKDKNGRLKISIGNCRLDFSKDYFLNGFTKKTVKLSYQNGDQEVTLLGKVEDRGKYFALYTEGWSFIEHLNKEEEN